MDLRSRRPLWSVVNGGFPAWPALDGDASCEVAVLGAGITGALIAHRLAREGMDVMAVDRRAPAAGSTAASTALLQYEPDAYLCDLAEKIGLTDARRAYTLCLRGIDFIAEAAARTPDGCAFERRRSLYFASVPGDVEKLRREHDARRSCGIDVEWLERRDVERRFSFSAPGAILSAAGAQVDPVRMTHALFAAAASMGARMRGEADVRAIEIGDGGATLRVRGGARLRARRVVVAGGYESAAFLSSPIAALKSTYAIATRPVQGAARWESGCMMWETARPYAYLRTGPQGRILIGGEDEDFRDPERRDALIPEKAARLRARLQKMFCGFDPEVETAWAGTFGETKDSLAYIGAEEGRSEVLFALGYGGNGITYSAIAAEIIADLVRGRPNADARIFRFGR